MATHHHHCSLQSLFRQSASLLATLFNFMATNLHRKSYANRPPPLQIQPPNILAPKLSTRKSAHTQTIKIQNVCLGSPSLSVPRKNQS